MFLFYFFNFCEWIIKKNKENSNVLSFNFFFLSINYFGEVWMAMTALSISRKSCKNSWTCIWACNSCPPHFTKPPDVPDWSPCQADFAPPPPESYALHSHLYYFVWNCTSFRCVLHTHPDFEVLRRLILWISHVVVIFCTGQHLWTEQ